MCDSQPTPLHHGSHGTHMGEKPLLLALPLVLLLLLLLLLTLHAVA